MNLNQAIKELMKGKVVANQTSGEMRYFLFGSNNQIYYVHDTEINEDKKQLAIRSGSRPHLLSENWWEDKWEIYEEKVEKSTDDKLKRIKAILEEE